MEIVIQRYGHEGWSHPPSRVLKGTKICNITGRPLDKRMFLKMTKLESKHRYVQEKSLSLDQRPLHKWGS